MPRPKTADVFHPVDAHLAERLARRRRDLGLSQSELDRRLDFPPGTVGKFERRRRLMTVEHLFLLSRALDRPIPWFFEGFAEDDAAVADAGVEQQAGETQAFLEMYGAIGETAVRREVAALVKAVAAWYDEDTGRP